MEGLLDGLQNEGGAFIILGILTVGMLLIVREWMQGANKRHEEDVAREQRNADAYRETTERMVGVVEGNTDALSKHAVAITSLTEVVRPMNETLQRMDRHLSSQDKPQSRTRNT